MQAAVAYRAVLLAAALLAAGLLLEQLMSLLLALAVTIIISLPLSAAASFAQRHGLPRALGAILALFSGIGVAAGVGFLIIPEFIQDARLFAERLPATLTAAERYVHGLTGVATKKLSDDVSNFVSGYLNHPDKLAAPLESVGLTIAELAAGVVVVIITALYIAINPDGLRNGFLRLFSADRQPQIQRIMSRVRTAWIGWLLAMVTDMLVLGGLLYLGMRIVGLDFAIGFAVFSAALTVIPNYGSIISAIPPIIFGLAQSLTTGVLVLVVYIIVNQIEGNLILPLIMARTLDLPPAVVTIGVLVMAQLFGLFGVVISIPLLSLIIILFEELWIAPLEASTEPPQTVLIE